MAEKETGKRQSKQVRDQAHRISSADQPPRHQLRDDRSVSDSDPGNISNHTIRTRPPATKWKHFRQDTLFRRASSHTIA